jgi:hypothetical protein
MGCPDLWQLEEPYAFLRASGHLIICPPWHRTDGASIPRFLWPVFGHPFDGPNKFWATPHDAGYNGWAIVMRVGIAPDQWLEHRAGMYAYERVPARHISPRSFSRRWWDEAMLESMRVCRESGWKRAGVYAGVRAFGRQSGSCL